MPVRSKSLFAPFIAAVATIAMVAAMWIAIPTGSSALASRRGNDKHDHPQRDVDKHVRLNQIQVIGSHNSYHELPPQSEIDAAPQPSTRLATT